MAKYAFYGRNDKTHSFINPYTFVRIDPKKKAKYKAGDTRKNLHSGVILCELTLKTPLIIPDTECRKPDPRVKDHWYYPFMTTENGVPMIPASSIRGPVRSVYETYTDSCFGTIRRQFLPSGQELGQTITARTAKPFTPGVLVFEDGKITLREAERYKIFKRDAAIRNYENGYGQPVFFTSDGFFVKEVYDEEGAGRTPGYMAIGEYIGNKKYESILVPGAEIEVVKNKEDAEIKEAEEQKILRSALAGLRDTLTAYQNPSINTTARHGKYIRFEKRLNEIEETGTGVLPLWYSMDGETLHLSPACIGRFGYEKTLNKKIGFMNACINRDILCKACNLFGMIGKNGGEGSQGSRIRFTDAVLKSGTPVMEDHVLKEMGTPRISYLPFYSRKEGGQTSKNGYDDSATMIAGRKYYWHHIPHNYESNEKTNRNAGFQILKASATPGSKGNQANAPLRFEFSVFFDNLKATEFNELLWVLCLGENRSDGDKCYKIGHAKPLGFGSVKITIKSVRERKYGNGEYKIHDISFEKYTNKPNTITNTNWDKVLLFHALENTGNGDVDVRYPIVHFTAADGITSPDKLKENVLAAHQWYRRNYPLGSKHASYLLPEISDQNQAIPDIKTDRFDLRHDRKKG